MAAFLSVLGTIGVIAMVLWRVLRALHMASDLAKTAHTVAKVSRQMKPKPKMPAQSPAQINNPQEAAALLMLLVARAGNVSKKTITRAQTDSILNQISQHFEFDQAMAESLLIHVAGLGDQLNSAAKVDAAMQSSSHLIGSAVSPKELIELEDMLMQVAHAKGNPNAAQKELLNQFALRVGI
ncbi:MAG: hypothetical protein COA47_09140 [Robiginitomaculum sp.]|nr:MAG: hypothetical protein COA47_09140 [Robiginitomaculum sp.]